MYGIGRKNRKNRSVVRQLKSVATPVSAFPLFQVSSGLARVRLGNMLPYKNSFADAASTDKPYGRLIVLL
jgi:hypothetical protein